MGEGGGDGGRCETLPRLKSRANTPREHFFICLLASPRARFAIMRQHLHNSVFGLKGPRRPSAAQIFRRESRSMASRLMKARLWLGSAASEVVTPPDSHRLICLFEIAMFCGLFFFFFWFCYLLVFSIKVEYLAGLEKFPETA